MESNITDIGNIKLALREKAKQSIFASIIGISQPAISEYLKNGTLTKGDSYETWLKEYCAHIRNSAAGRPENNDELRAAKIRLDNARAIQSEVIEKYPGIDAFTCAWIRAGGQYDTTTGQLQGMTMPMTTTDFAKVLKVQARVQEAVKRGQVLVAAHRRVIRQTMDDNGKKRNLNSDGYCLPGITVLPLSNAGLDAISPEDRPLPIPPTITSGSKHAFSPAAVDWAGLIASIPD